MSRRPEPRRILLDGAPAVVLTPEEYERLVLARRQLGGQSSRMSVLNRDLSVAAHLLEEARAELCTTDDNDGCPAGRSGQEDDRLCCRIRALLDSDRFAATSRLTAWAADSGPKPQRRTRRAPGPR